MKPNGRERSTIDHERRGRAPSSIEQVWGAGHLDSAELPQIGLEERAPYHGGACFVSRPSVPNRPTIPGRPKCGRDPKRICSRKRCTERRGLSVPKRYLSVVEEPEVGILSELSSDFVEPKRMEKVVVVKERDD